MIVKCLELLEDVAGLSSCKELKGQHSRDLAPGRLVGVEIWEMIIPFTTVYGKMQLSLIFGSILCFREFGPLLLCVLWKLK